MSRGRFAYDPVSWRSLLDEEQLTVERLAQMTGIGTRQIYNILEGKTIAAHMGTAQKVKAGLKGSGLSAERVDDLFFRRNDGR